MQQLFSPHVNVRFGLLILVLPSDVAHDGVQVEPSLHSKWFTRDKRVQTNRRLFGLIFLLLL